MSTEDDNDPKEQPLVSHLVELRDRILRCAVAVILVFLGLFYWSNDIYEFVATPLTSKFAPDENMINTTVTGGFMAPFKLTFMMAICITIPYLLHQAWAFISPGLYKNEVRVTFPILVSSIILFYMGISFCYYLVLGPMFAFFTSTGPDNVKNMIDVHAFLDFVLAMFFTFGIIFEIPVATVLLVLSGVTTPARLIEKRGYVIIGCFAVAIPLTPADPFSQSIMAIPMWMLFELGVLAARILHKPDPEDVAAEAAEKEGA